MTVAEHKLHYGPLIAKWMTNDGFYLYKKYETWPSEEVICSVLKELFEGRLTLQQSKNVFEDFLAYKAEQNNAGRAD